MRDPRLAPGLVVSSLVVSFVVSLSVVVLGPVEPPRPVAPPVGPPGAGRGDPGAERVARGRRFAVASAAPEVSAAALEVLDEGGNVVDAAIAATFAVSVARPQSTGLGGGGFFLVRDGETGAVEALDAREVAPAKAQRDGYRRARESLDGARAVAVPGLVPGALDLLARRGTLSRARLLAPAIRLARDGVRVGPGLAAACRARREVLARDAAASALFLPGGRPLEEGSLLRQEDLARTLEAIVARGRAALDEGPIASAIEKATGGFVTPGDLAAYRPRAREPLRGSYRGREVIAFPPPSGGVVLLEMLNVLERFPLASLAADVRAHLLVESMRRAYRDRAAYLGDPDFARVPARGLASPAYARGLAEAIDPERATPSASLEPGPAARYEPDHTTHFSIVDARGNAVASTQTVNGALGAAVVAPGTGIVLNNEMDDFTTRPGEPNLFGLVQGETNAVGAGKRPLSSMTPTFVVEGREVVVALGSPGGSRIVTAVLQTIVNRLDLGLSPGPAVSAARIHHQWLPDEVWAEPGVPDETVRGLERRGHRVVQKGPGSDVEAVFREPAGELVGVSDPRSEGRPAAR